MTTRSAARRGGGPVAARAARAGVLLLAVAACTAVPPDSTTVPAAAPSGVQQIAAGGEPANAICTVRSSFAPSSTPPRAILGRAPGQGLVAGVDPSDATMSHWNAVTQQFEGFNIDLLLAVVRAIWPGEEPRKRLTFKVVPPGQGAFEMLAPDHPDRVDVIATSLTASCERAKQVVFSNDYLDSGQTALVRRVDGRPDGPPEYTGIEQLGGRRVCAAARTTSLAAIASYRTADGAHPVPVQAAHAIDCLVMLRQGQVDAVSTDENILIGFTRMAPDTVLVTESPRDNAPFCRYHDGRRPCTWFTDEPHAFAFARDNPDSVELARFVNHVLESTRASGAWSAAHQQWLADHPDRGQPTPGPPVTSWPPG
ncbi:transporter substrate-binding domain-containing protein [Micromonospora sp. NBC_01655]|uniref:transporter substrate-binding domain-containing protein n=1 Tax=Micromonospora sp. NBC_01655 TaxID=2975983 RepID=UPI002258EE6B|nr:transporter substrate-binding domain-containing protein [Micromonospora sp. NBC_01655]MCX4473524.1 transporter substrate-binding domain-containing protein [Micromonospora sp. NBC_01655]